MDKKKYIGKLILIGLSFTTENGDILEQFQTNGYIESIDNNGLMRIRREGLPIFSIPFDEESISDAKPGLYKGRSTGAEVIDPDYFTSWSIRNAKIESIERYKRHGFEEYIRPIIKYDS